MCTEEKKRGGGGTAETRKENKGRKILLSKWHACRQHDETDRKTEREREGKGQANEINLWGRGKETNKEQRKEKEEKGKETKVQQQSQGKAMKEQIKRARRRGRERKGGKPQLILNSASYGGYSGSGEERERSGRR